MDLSSFIRAFVAQIFWALGIFLDKYLLTEQAEEVNNHSTDNDEEQIPTAVGMLVITTCTSAPDFRNTLVKSAAL